MHHQYKLQKLLFIPIIPHGTREGCKKLNYFITPGLFPVHIVIWCPDWFLLRKYRDLYFPKWVLDVESDFLLSDCIVSSEKFGQFLRDIRISDGLYAHRWGHILTGNESFSLKCLLLTSDFEMYRWQNQIDGIKNIQRVLFSFLIFHSQA